MALNIQEYVCRHEGSWSSRQPVSMGFRKGLIIGDEKIREG